MAVEIERRFLMDAARFDRAVGEGTVTSRRSFRQAYLSATGPSAIRVRIARDPDGEMTARLTIKSTGSGMTRGEFEYEIPVQDASEMMETIRVGRIIEKERMVVEFAGFAFELDRFGGELGGLYLAEIEIPSEDTEIPRPDWLGPEITGDKRFSNAALALADAVPQL
ncbi:MAG: CYTH domain-containing protein [Alphaproteobacteria bacterium]|nr:CYTH domain-containing protein [Alphaproteobacteria bacterium]